MTKSKSIECDINVGFRSPFKDEKELKSYGDELLNYIKEESKQIPKLKLVIQEAGLLVLSGRNTVRLIFSKKALRIILRTSDASEALKTTNSFLNIIMSFLGSSETGVAKVFVDYSKKIDLSKNPLPIFINKIAVAKFSEQVKRSFSVFAIALKSEGDNPLALFIGVSRKGYLVSISVRQSYKDKLPWDVMKQLNQTINNSKRIIINTLGVNEK